MSVNKCFVIKRKYGSHVKTTTQIRVELCSQHKHMIYNQVCRHKKERHVCLASSINTVQIVTLHSYLAFKFHKTTSCSVLNYCTDLNK